MSETFDHSLEARLVDLDLIADAIRTTLISQPGLLRLEPTVRSALSRLKVSSVNALHHALRPDEAEPKVSISDGLILSVADGVVNAQIDIATDIGHPALKLAETVQALSAETIQRKGLTVGSINVTILSIEGSPHFPGATPPQTLTPG